eukprot:8218466-Alexandrium_andersonii.AAC.1
MLDGRRHSCFGSDLRTRCQEQRHAGTRGDGPGHQLDVHHQGASRADRRFRAQCAAGQRVAHAGARASGSMTRGV